MEISKKLVSFIFVSVFLVGISMSLDIHARTGKKAFDKLQALTQDPVTYGLVGYLPLLNSEADLGEDGLDYWYIDGRGFAYTDIDEDSPGGHPFNVFHITTLASPAYFVAFEQYVEVSDQVIELIRNNAVDTVQCEGWFKFQNANRGDPRHYIYFAVTASYDINDPDNDDPDNDDPDNDGDYDLEQGIQLRAETTNPADIQYTGHLILSEDVVSSIRLLLYVPSSGVAANFDSLYCGLYKIIQEN